MYFHFDLVGSQTEGYFSLHNIITVFFTK